MSTKTQRATRKPLDEAIKDRLSTGWGLAHISTGDWPRITKVAKVDYEATRRANTIEGYRMTVVCRMEGATTHAHYHWPELHWYRGQDEFEELCRRYASPKMLVRLNITTEDDAYGDTERWLILLSARNKAECEKWFNRFERRVATPREYDCTGQSFTQDWKFGPSPAKGIFAIQHTIGIDV